MGSKQGWSPGLGLCSEVGQLALLHACLQLLCLGCQRRLLLKGPIPFGIPLRLHIPTDTDTHCLLHTYAQTVLSGTNFLSKAPYLLAPHTPTDTDKLAVTHICLHSNVCCNLLVRGPTPVGIVLYVHTLTDTSELAATHTCLHSNVCCNPLVRGTTPLDIPLCMHTLTDTGKQWPLPPHGWTRTSAAAGAQYDCAVCYTPEQACD